MQYIIAEIHNIKKICQILEIRTMQKLASDRITDNVPGRLIDDIFDRLAIDASVKYFNSRIEIISKKLQ